MGGIISGGMSFRTNKVAQKDAKHASNDLTRRMEGTAADYEARRPEAAQERMRALRAQLGLLGPLNDMTSQVTGQHAMDFGPVSESPLSMTPLESQLDPYTKGKLDYSRAGVGPGTSATDTRAALEQRLMGQGYNVQDTRQQSTRDAIARMRGRR